MGLSCFSLSVLLIVSYSQRCFAGCILGSGSAQGRAGGTGYESVVYPNVLRGGKGSHRNYVHPALSKPISISGKLGDDAKQYQVRAVKRALEELAK